MSGSSAPTRRKGDQVRQELADAKKTTEDAKVKKVEAEKTAKALAQEIKNFERNEIRG